MENVGEKKKWIKSGLGTNTIKNACTRSCIRPTFCKIHQIKSDELEGLKPSTLLNKPETCNMRTTKCGMSRAQQMCMLKHNRKMTNHFCYKLQTSFVRTSNCNTISTTCIISCHKLSQIAILRLT